METEIRLSHMTKVPILVNWTIIEKQSDNTKRHQTLKQFDNRGIMDRLRTMSTNTDQSKVKRQAGKS